MTSIKWKSAEILKVFGTTLREGTFTGGKATPTGSIEADVPTKFTPDYIAAIYDGISSHVPFVINHKVGNNAHIGYAYKFGVNDSLDDMQYQGFVFDSDAKHKIITEGYDNVSPEIVEENGVPRLVAIAFVKNPAISGTDVGFEATVFSQPTTNTTSGDNIVSNTPTETPTTNTDVSTSTSTQAPAVSTVTPNITVNVPPTPTNTDSTTAADIAALRTQMDEYKMKYEQQAAKTEQILTGQYHALTAELKGLGIEDPSTIVHGLATEQKIAVLTKMKDSIAKNRPLAQPTPSTGESTDSSSDGERKKLVKEIATEFGLTEDQYKKLTGGN